MDEPFTHWANCEIESPKQGTFSLAPQSFIQFQIAARGCIQCHEFAQAVRAQRVEQVQCVGLSLFEIVDDCASGTNRKAVGFYSKAIQRG